MNYTFRKAVKQDAGRINQLFIEMMQTIRGDKSVNGYPDGYLDKFFDSRDEWIAVATDNDEIIAFLSIEVHHEDKEYIYLDDLSVTNRHRNNGIGTKLIKIAESYAGEINISTICFHVEKTNTNALRLYHRLGYKIHQDQTTRYLMIKHLEQNNDY